MQTTGNLGLKKPEGTDVVNIDDLNYNADILDQEVAKRIINSGGVSSIQAGLDATKPAPGTAGRLYVATDTQVIYRDNGTAWVKVGVVKWDDIEGKPSSFTPSAHTHIGSDVTSKVSAASTADTVPWTGVSGKPSSFTPSAHTHAGSDITSKVSAASTADTVPWSGISGKPSSFTPSAHKTTHATGGSDALTPADIGAQDALPAENRRKITFGTAEPTGGADGDIYFQYE